MNYDVPALRFPEFTEEWQGEQLHEIAELSKGTGISKEQLSENGTPCILYGELYTKYKSEIISKVISKTDIEESKLKHSKQNDVIIPCSGETAIDIAVARCVPFDNVLLGGDLNVIRLHKYDGAFMAYQLNGKRKTDIAKLAQGVSVVHLYGENLKSIKTYNPSLQEQQKIVKLLSMLDERLEVQNKIIEKYESLIQAIIYQKKMDGIREGNWQKTELSKVLQERTEKNINGYTVCSVSVSQGVINQIEYLGRSFAAKETSHYNIVKYGDIVYTKSPTGDFPYGIVKRSYIKNAVAVSPLYGVYKPINDNIGVFLHFYFMQSNNAFNYLHPLIQKGAKNTINITNARFLENSIPLPKTEDEVVYIANALTSIQTKIDLEKSLLCSYEKEKQYLLRQMFI
ncbi:MAG TPA: restriction endonuclease subunit S [Phocaeicola coprocola]|uniref:Restriction endonuclease subunit S n=1 Tax=Phocaeicola coprocola TaxID=310298 RepID=A0A921K3P1_9BACT|nr:restriction endonuclease subunit S [Phocaeicola coprocola]